MPDDVVPQPPPVASSDDLYALLLDDSTKAIKIDASNKSDDER